MLRMFLQMRMVLNSIARSLPKQILVVADLLTFLRYLIIHAIFGLNCQFMI